MFNTKLSLVTSTGLLLASKPETADETKQILATGLMTALISFSKEVHQRELQSISYHDRTVSFLRVHDFVLIVETIGEDSTVTERQLVQLLEYLIESAEPLLEDKDPNSLTEGEAALIIETCLQGLLSFQIQLAEQPLKKAETAIFTLNHLDKAWQISDKSGSGPFMPLIASMLGTHKENLDSNGTFKGLITQIPDENCTTFTVIDSNREITKVGILKLPLKLDAVLFRLYPMIERMLSLLSKDSKKSDIESVLDILRDIDDPGPRLTRISIEDLSPTFLDRTAGRNLERAIYSAIVGDEIFVVGDKPTVRLVIDTLSIFTQHLQTSVNVWITMEDVDQNEKCDLTSRICGMSPTIYNSLFQRGLIDETVTTINLERSRVKGMKSSVHYKKLFDTVKRLKITEVANKIAIELEDLIEAAMRITSFALYDAKKAKIKMKELTTQTNLPPSLIRKAVELAKKRNYLLSYLI